MYERHSTLFEPRENYIIWQYMSFAKFVNLLLGDMYFRRIDSFEDVFEGKWPDLNKKYIDHIKTTEGQVIGSFDDMARKMTYVSCFHKADSETAFMWKQYSNNDGIAIRTTIERLKHSFDKTDNPIYISEVKYIDYVKEHISDMSNMFVLSIHKRKSFQYENEIRCISLLNDLHDEEGYNKKYFKENRIDFEKFPLGIKIPIDLYELIEKIYISPYAEDYLREDVEACLNVIGLKVDVIKSKLYEIT